MYLLSLIVVGMVGGWLAGKILKGDSYGPFMDIVMGIGGAVAGGLLMRSAGPGGAWGVISTTIVAMLGAAVLTLVVGYVNGKRMYARQF
jgi:uncharacterized membrane protein YeaQ/YmgE (transglycosylase-associated protein family)